MMPRKTTTRVTRDMESTHVTKENSAKSCETKGGDNLSVEKITGVDGQTAAGNHKMIFDTSGELSVDDFCLGNNFHHVADIIQTPVDSGRKTLITFVPKDDAEWKVSNEWLYMIVINGKIVKIGGTRTSLKDRSGSYLCGHHTTHRGGSGKCSVTNAVVYDTLDYYLTNGSKIEMYGYKLEKCVVLRNVFDNDVEIEASTYFAFESRAINRYKTQRGSIPPLCKNSDPKHRD